jgi:beta-xylosidase
MVFLRNRKGFDMWAPDCVFKSGTYYLYFPVGGRIGVATSDKPFGPWKVLDKPVTGVRGIDLLARPSRQSLGTL